MTYTTQKQSFDGLLTVNRIFEAQFFVCAFVFKITAKL